MKKTSVIVVGLYILLYLVPLGIHPVFIPDETRYAEIPREMIASGDWVVPHLNGLRYFEKPVLGYWMEAASILLFGESAFAIRFPSALAAGISGLILFFLARRFAGGYSTGVLTSAIFLTFLEVIGVGSFCVLDSLLSLFITAAMAVFFFAYMEEEPSKKAGLLVLSGIFCGLAFLTKGFIGFAIPLVAVVPFFVWERRWEAMLKLCWIPVVVAALVSLPWAVLIYLREPDFWHFFFWNEHIRRFISDNAQHTKPFWYFLFLFPGAALPWTFLFPSTISGLLRSGLERPVVRFAVCWFLFPFLFFSFSHGKLLTYILPCFPPLALLTGEGLCNNFSERGKRAYATGALSLALMTAVAAIALAVVLLFDINGFGHYIPTWQGTLATAGLLSWMFFLILSLRVSAYQKKILLFAAAPMLLMFGSHFFLAHASFEHKEPGEFLLHHAQKIRPDMILISDEAMVGAVCWFYKRSDVYLLASPGELLYGIRFADSKYRLLSLEQFKALVSQKHKAGRVALIVQGKNYKNWANNLPKPMFVSINDPDGFVFSQY